VFRWPSGA